MAKKCRNGLHELTPANTLKGNRGCRLCKQAYEGERVRNRRPPPKPKPVVEVVNPYRSDYEYGHAIHQRKRQERQTLIHAAMNENRARFNALTDKEKRQLVFMMVAGCQRV